MFGKVIGGGLPLAALGGRADVMDQLAPLGPVYQAGTLSGNPLATAAGLAVLAAARRRRLRRPSTRDADALRRRPARRVRRRRHRGAGRRRSARSPACSSPTTPVTTTPTRRAPTTRATRGSSTACSSAGVFLAAERLRDAVRVPRAHRRRDRRDAERPRPTPRRTQLAADADVASACYWRVVVLAAGGCGARGP